MCNLLCCKCVVNPLVMSCNPMSNFRKPTLLMSVNPLSIFFNPVLNTSYNPLLSHC